MSRSRSTDRRITRRRKILKLAKGFRGRRGTNFKAARDAVRKSLVHSYEGIINRKALSNMAIEDPVAFKAIVELSKKAIGE